MRRASRREGARVGPAPRDIGVKGGMRAVRVRTRSFPRRRYLVLAAVLGMAVAIGPVVASFATEPTIEATGGSYGYGFRWSPSTAEVKEGGTVTFQNTSTSVPHGVEWTGGPEAPSCPGVPINEGKTGWKGRCTFAHPGTYTFRCVVHPTEMTGTVTVSANGAVTTTMTSPPPVPPATTTGITPAVPSESPLVSSAAGALKLAKSQRGGVVKGSIDISNAGAGDRLEVDVFAAKGLLAKHAGPSRVGAFSRSSVPGGQTSFSVKLDSKALRALKRRQELRLTVKVTLTPLYGTPLTITRLVVERGKKG